MNPTSEQLFKQLRNLLKARGISCYVHNRARTTDSIYVKFERPEFCSLRIGSHDGREKYKYKFNLRTDIDESYSEIDDGVKRFYFPPIDVEPLAECIEDFQKSRSVGYVDSL